MNKALLATDASAASLRAAKVLGDLASRDPELMVTIIHVVPLPEVLTPSAAAGTPLTLPAQMDDYVALTLPAIIAATVKALALPPERIKTVHVIGTAAENILGEARNGHYDLIVLGRRGLSTLGEIFLGSVSQAVLHRAPCPVVLVP